MNEELNSALDLGALLGRTQAFSGIAGRCSAAHVRGLKTIREEGKYKLTGLSWEDFCPRVLGVSRGHVDKQIRLLNELGDAYFELSAIAPITPDDYRLIKAAVEGDAVTVGGNRIAITPHNAKELTAAVQTLTQEARLALPAPQVDPPPKTKKAKTAKKAVDPMARAIDQLHTVVADLERQVAAGPGKYDRALLTQVFSSASQRLGRLDRTLR